MLCSCFHRLLPICLAGAFVLVVAGGGGYFSVRTENQPHWGLGSRHNLPSACWRVWFCARSLDGEESFHPRGFSLSPPGQAKGCSLIKTQCRKHEQSRRCLRHGRSNLSFVKVEFSCPITQIVQQRRLPEHSIIDQPQISFYNKVYQV